MMAANVDPKVRVQAEQWFARRLDPVVQESERNDFERWREQDPQHAEAYAQVQRFWDRLAALKTSTILRDLASQAAVGGDTASPDSRSRLVAWKPLLLAAGVAALAIIGTITITDRPQVQAFSTAVGEQRTETLPDGTTLRVNTASTLDVRLTDRRREVHLVSGEAAFDVAKDAERPFVVSAGDGTITALGTHFQVRHEMNRVTVTLIEGRVQLARAERREVEWLDPGQQAAFTDDESGIVRRNVDVHALTSWMGGRLEFNGTPLEQAVAEANRYSARRIRIAAPVIASIAVSGTFRSGDVDGMAAAFEAAFPVRAESSAREIVLYSR